MINVALIPRLCRVEPYVADLSRKEWIPQRTQRTRGEIQENHSNQQDIVTHMLDPRNTKRYKIHDQQGTIQRVTGSSP